MLKGRIEPKAVTRNKMLLTRDSILVEKIKEVVDGFPATGVVHKLIVGDDHTHCSASASASASK